MAEAERLTLAYVEAHPGDAARVLERLPTAQATAFFASLPARVLAPAFAAMLPIAAGRILAELPDAETVDLLSALGTQPALSVLRHVPEAIAVGQFMTSTASTPGSSMSALRVSL